MSQITDKFVLKAVYGIEYKKQKTPRLNLAKRRNTRQ